MYLTEDLETHIFSIPYQKGYRKLRILTGYASSAFLNYIINKYPEIELELIIGMASNDGISFWDHSEYIRLTNNHQISVRYNTTLPGIHTKIYYWEGQHSDSAITFIGSANFSWNGFRDQHELMAEVDYPNISEVFNVGRTISCTDVTSEIDIYHMRVFSHPYNGLSSPSTSPKAFFTRISKKGRLTENRMLLSVDLPLLINNDTAIQERGGLNWGQREGREPNQAYLKVPSEIHKSNPNFFPPEREPFNLITDTGQSYLCVMAQGNRKAIETTENNSLLGIHFRKVLGVELGARVDASDVLKYGRTTIRITKLDSETYYMDYSMPKQNLSKISKSPNK